MTLRQVHNLFERMKVEAEKQDGFNADDWNELYRQIFVRDRVKLYVVESDGRASVHTGSGRAVEGMLEEAASIVIECDNPEVRRIVTGRR